MRLADVIPTLIGRFRIERILGQGGFGVVYLAEDVQLKRQVAIKVPNPQFVQRPDDRELYLKEARTVARFGWQRRWLRSRMCKAPSASTLAFDANTRLALHATARWNDADQVFPRDTFKTVQN